MVTMREQDTVHPCLIISIYADASTATRWLRRSWSAIPERAARGTIAPSHAVDALIRIAPHDVKNILICLRPPLAVSAQHKPHYSTGIPTLN